MPHFLVLACSLQIVLRLPDQTGGLVYFKTGNQIQITPLSVKRFQSRGIVVKAAVAGVPEDQQWLLCHMGLYY
jgi:hypothetical protein